MAVVNLCMFLLNISLLIVMFIIKKFVHFACSHIWFFLTLLLSNNNNNNIIKKYKKHASLYRYPKKCIKGRFMCNWVKGFRRPKLNLNSITFQFTFSLLFSVPIHFRSPKILQPIAHELALKVFTKNFTIIYYLYRWL